MGTVNIASLATSQAIGYSDAAISRDAAGAIALGNFVFNVDSTVGAGQDNYVLTYDDATGEIGLEAAAGGSGGDVVGPAGSTDNAIARYDTTTGKLLQNSGATVDDSGNVVAPAVWVTLIRDGAGSAQVNLANSGYYAARGFSSFSFKGNSTSTLTFSSGSDSNAGVDTTVGRSGAGVLYVLGSATGAAIELTEMTAPSAPAANKVRLYTEDNGSGKTRLMALFATGAAQQIAIEP